MSRQSDASADAIADFDHHSEEFNREELRASAEIRRKCPVAWNERYGGFWFVSGYDAVAQSARDCVTFAHKYEPDAADGIDYQGEIGVPRPPGQPALGVGEVDGPFHESLRRAIAKFFSPKAVGRLRPFMEQCANFFLDQHIDAGQMDLLLDYASPVPAILTLRLMGLPLEDWRMYSNLFHATVAFPPESVEYQTAISEIPTIMGNLLQFARERRANPQDDLTSELVAMEFEGDRLDDGQLIDVIWNLVAGGVDTTTSQTALSLSHLAAHPELRRQLIERPELYKTATDEYLRYFSVNQQLSRTVTADIVLAGQQLRRNDKVILSWLAANHDENQFERPDEVILDRVPNRHVAFGGGAHRCIGSHLAKAMFEVMLEVVLKRIPDYEVDPAEVEEYLGSPAMTGLNKLPATFTPGVSFGTQQPV